MFRGLAGRRLGGVALAETWNISGDYLAACNCRVSPCPCTTAGGDPTEGTCKNVLVMAIKRGKYGNTDLSGLHTGLVGQWTGNVLKGNWSVGLLIDDKANDAQAKALETILSGQGGGTFKDLAPLIGKVLGVARAKMSLQITGETGTAKADGCDFAYEPLKSPAGRRTEVHHGALAFRDRIFPGKAKGGKIDHFGIQGATDYGEYADFEFSGP